MKHPTYLAAKAAFAASAAIATLTLGVGVGAPAWAQDAAKGIAEYRKMLEDGNPAELYEAKGEELWKQKRGPKGASLEACDLGKGPGVVKGAFVELPRYFADTQRVQDLESRLMTCMVDLQGFNAAEISKTAFGKGEMANITAMATWIALLRGVNVSGRNRLPMAELRRALEAAGEPAHESLRRLEDGLASAGLEATAAEPQRRTR